MTPLPIDPDVLRSITPAPVAPVARPERSRRRSDDARDEQQHEGRREPAAESAVEESPVDADGHVDVRA